MKIGPTPTSIYSKKEYEDYRDRLIRTLYNEGLSAIDIVNNTEYKDFIYNWVTENVINAKARDTLMGISKRLSNMEVQFSNGQDPITFPIMNEYKGHHLIKSYYFKKDKDGKVEVKTIDVIDGGSGRLIVV